jgi:hypothetical protein
MSLSRDMRLKDAMIMSLRVVTEAVSCVEELASPRSTGTCNDGIDGPLSTEQDHTGDQALRRDTHV